MRRVLAFALAGLFAGVVACEETPTTPEASSSTEAPAEISGVHGTSSMNGLLNSNAAFRNWKHGYNHGTGGWYGMEMPEGLGLCGTIEQTMQRSGDVSASAGRAYATVEQGGCNAHFSDMFGSGLVGVPWAPGPGFAALLPWEGDGELLVDSYPVTEAGWYTLFTSVSRGLELPIDEYRVRRGS